jgi:hypothetical protein
LTSDADERILKVFAGTIPKGSAQPTYHDDPGER